MVTFFCNNCGNYLKKKQAEMHGFCNDLLSCNDCKKDIIGYEAIKGHTTCGIVLNGKKPAHSHNHPAPKAQPTTQKSEEPSNGHIHKNGVSQNEEILELEWNGFRNTLRRIVKRHPNKEIGKLALKKKLRLAFERVKPEKRDSYEGRFERKLMVTRNLEVSGDKVRHVLGNN